MTPTPPSNNGNVAANPSTRWPITIAVSIGASIIVALILLAFLWPTTTSSAKDLPLLVSGEGQTVSTIEAQLAKSGAFSISKAENRDVAVAKIKDRQAYGAVIVSGTGANTGIEVIQATGASPAVAQLMTQISGSLQQGIAQQSAAAHAAALQAAIQSGKLDAVAAAAKASPAPKVSVTDVAPLNPGDPRGAGLSLLGLPLAMGGMIGGVLISLVVTGFRRRLSAAAVYGVVAGIILISIMQGWMGILSGNFALNSLAMGLGLFATAVTIIGLESLIGRPGIAVGALLTMFVGNPISSLASPKEFLPWYWGDIGQWFVPGATGTLLRDLSYFPSASQAMSWLALGAWAVGGVILAIIGRRRNDVAINVPGTLDPA